MWLKLKTDRESPNSKFSTPSANFLSCAGHHPFWHAISEQMESTGRLEAHRRRAARVTARSRRRQECIKDVVWTKCQQRLKCVRHFLSSLRSACFWTCTDNFTSHLGCADKICKWALSMQEHLLKQLPPTTTFKWEHLQKPNTKHEMITLTLERAKLHSNDRYS